MRKFVLGMVLASTAFAAQADKAQLHGYGARPCQAYLKAYAGWEKGEEESIAEYLRYEDWLSGFVSGLSLAVNEDVMYGVDAKGAMRRNQLYCIENTESDFLNATMKLLETVRKDHKEP